MATKTTESSVMMALGELARLEQDRIEAQRRAEEAARAEAERVAREAELAARRQAELERARVEAEARAKAELEVAAAASRDRSLDELRARVAAVQAEREALRDELRARVGRASSEPPRRTPWALAFGLSSVVAAGLAGLLVVQQSRPVEIARVPVAPIVVAPAPEPVESAAIEPAPEPAAAPAVAEAAPAARPHRVRDRVRRVEETAAEREHRDSLATDLGLDDEDDDVLGGISTQHR